MTMDFDEFDIEILQCFVGFQSLDISRSLGRRFAQEGHFDSASQLEGGVMHDTWCSQPSISIKIDGNMDFRRHAGNWNQLKQNCETSINSMIQTSWNTWIFKVSSWCLRHRPKNVLRALGVNVFWNDWCLPYRPTLANKNRVIQKWWQKTWGTCVGFGMVSGVLKNSVLTHCFLRLLIFKWKGTWKNVCFSLLWREHISLAYSKIKGCEKVWLGERISLTYHNNKRIGLQISLVKERISSTFSQNN